MLTAVHIHENMVTWHQGNCTLLRGSKRFILFDLHTSVGDGCHASPKVNVGRDVFTNEVGKVFVGKGSDSSLRSE